MHLQRERIVSTYAGEKELALYRGQLRKKDVEEAIPEAIRVACRRAYFKMPNYAEEMARRCTNALRVRIWPDYCVGDQLIGLAPLGLANFSEELWDMFRYDLYVVGEKFGMSEIEQVHFVEDVVQEVKLRLVQ